MPPQHLDAAHLGDQAGGGDGAGAGDQHLVEQVARIGEDQEHAAGDVAALLGAERLDQGERDRGQDHHPGDFGGNDEGEQEIGDDQAEEHARIAGADAQHDRKGEPARQPGFAGDAPDQQGGEQEPGDVVGEAAEGDAERHDLERPEQEAADEAGQREFHRVGDPGNDHEGDDGKAVLGLRRDAERREPDGERDEDAEDAAEVDGPRLCRVRRQIG